MKQIEINPANKPYYSEDFIKEFECGTKTQFEADNKALEQEPCVDAVSRAEIKNKAIQIWNGGGDEDYKFSALIDYITDECKPLSEWQQDHAILKAYSDGANEVIDRVKQAREEIKDMQSHIQLKDKTTNEHWVFLDKFEVLAILDKLIAEVEG